MYTLEVNSGGTIVYEVQKGFWKNDDFNRFVADYENKIAPLVKGKKWAKCSDLTEYKTSPIVEGIKEHIKWASSIGLTNAAIIQDNVIIKMQMNRGDGGLIHPKMFPSKSEAVAWSQSEGYKD